MLQTHNEEPLVEEEKQPQERDRRHVLPLGSPMPYMINGSGVVGGVWSMQKPGVPVMAAAAPMRMGVASAQRQNTNLRGETALATSGGSCCMTARK